MQRKTNSGQDNLGSTSGKEVRPNRKTRTVDEVAAELGISRNAAYQAIEKGQIPHLRMGRRILIPAVALERLLETGNSGKVA